jgi:MFS family permease
MERRPKTDSVETSHQPERSEWLTALWFVLGTIVLGGSLFFLSPNGLSAWLSALPDYLRGWVQPSGVSAGLMLFSLVAYQPLGLILAIMATVRGWIQGSRRVMRLSLWMMIALLLALFYPSHQVGDLAWMLIPLWALAALELAHSSNVLLEERREVLGVAALIILILVFIWFDFLALVQGQGASQEITLRTWLLIGSFFLLVVSILLVAVGWSVRVARFGAVLGLMVALSVYSVSALMGAAGLRVMPDAVELTSPDKVLPESDLLLTTVDQISDWSNNNINSQPVTIAGIDSFALQWLLHEHQLNKVSALDISTSPPIVITTDKEDPALAAGYRGQSFVWRETPLWSQAHLSDLITWTSFHQIPVSKEMIIVWVRSDLFIDSTAPRP